MISCNYKGPIKGWNQHFKNYINSKAKALQEKDEENTFQPQINMKSKEMTRNMS